ncbi:MAG TPA: hypothetical protein VKZ59_08645 [Acidobacteriota bacterium]|nr:hypothetical protein [Acidobacteriota bacterium]
MALALLHDEQIELGCSGLPSARPPAGKLERDSTRTGGSSQFIWWRKRWEPGRFRSPAPGGNWQPVSRIRSLNQLHSQYLALGDALFDDTPSPISWAQRYTSGASLLLQI